MKNAKAEILFSKPARRIFEKTSEAVQGEAEAGFFSKAKNVFSNNAKGF